jgi:hypothetical protein
MFHISTHFKLLVSSFENIEMVVLDDTHEMKEQVHRLRPLRFFTKYSINSGSIHNTCTAVSNTDKTTAPAEEGTPYLLNGSRYSENIRSLIADEPSGNQTTEHDDVKGTPFHEQRMNDNFINCIKYHQAILE